MLVGGPAVTRSGDLLVLWSGLSSLPSAAAELQAYSTLLPPQIKLIAWPGLQTFVVGRGSICSLSSVFTRVRASGRSVGKLLTWQVVIGSSYFNLHPPLLCSRAGENGCRHSIAGARYAPKCPRARRCRGLCMCKGIGIWVSVTVAPIRRKMLQLFRRYVVFEIEIFFLNEF